MIKPTPSMRVLLVTLLATSSLLLGACAADSASIDRPEARAESAVKCGNIDYLSCISGSPSIPSGCANPENLLSICSDAYCVPVPGGLPNCSPEFDTCGDAVMNCYCFAFPDS